MINANIPWADYCQVKRMNPSTLVAGVHSMKRLKSRIDEGFPEETNAMRKGSGGHALLLEPDQFEKRFVVVPDFNLDPDNVTGKGDRSESKATTYYKFKIAEFARDNDSKTFLSRKDYDNCLYAVESIHSRPAMRELVTSSLKEVTVYGEILGVPFKGRLDLLNTTTISDLKNTASVHKRAFGRTFANLHYAFKLSIYRELVRQNTNRVLDVMLLTQELDGDFDNALVPVPDIVLDNAFERVEAVVKQYKSCLASGRWPGVDGGSEYYELYLPQWTLEDAEDLDWGDPVEAEDREVVF